MSEMLPEGWMVVPFEEVLTSPRELTYGVVQPGRPDHTGTPIVRVGDIRNGRVDLTNPLRIEPTVAERFTRSTIRGGELLISLVGTVGETAVAPPEMSGWNTARAVGVARIREDIGARWVARALKEPAAVALIDARLNTTVQATLNLKDLREVPIVLPPAEVRRAISRFADALDDKIESNRRATTVGESLIRALVESALDASEGADGALGDYCRLVKAPVKVEEISADDNYIGLEHMPRGSIFLTEWGNAGRLGSNKTAFQRGDVLFGKLRPYFKKVGIAPVNGVCSTDILAVRPNDPRDLALIAVVAASDALIDSLSAGSTGTRMPRASWKDLAAWQVPVLTPTERAELSDRVAPLIDRLEQLTFESRRLTALRDALLPELLSGRIRVPAEGVAV